MFSALAGLTGYQTGVRAARGAGPTPRGAFSTPTPAKTPAALPQQGSVADYFESSRARAQGARKFNDDVWGRGCGR